MVTPMGHVVLWALPIRNCTSTRAVLGISKDHRVNPADPSAHYQACSGFCGADDHHPFRSVRITLLHCLSNHTNDKKTYFNTRSSHFAGHVTYVTGRSSYRTLYRRNSKECQKEPQASTRICKSTHHQVSVREVTYPASRNGSGVLFYHQSSCSTPDSFRYGCHPFIHR